MLTNPEMLHQGILPFHRRWATFLMRLRYIVVAAIALFLVWWMLRLYVL